MLIDKEAQRSGLSRISPAAKLLTALYCALNCIAADNIATSLITFFAMSSVVCIFGGLKFARLLRLYGIPLFFTVVGAAALAVESGKADYIVGFMGIGVTYSGLICAAEVFLRCMGAVSAVYFLSLTTPAPALFAVLRRTPIPDFITETVELVYRYIFVLYDSYKKINVAQGSRLGYNGLKAKYRSTALIGGAVFVKALDRAKRGYIAMESRGYNGCIKTLHEEYELRVTHVICFAALCALVTVSGVMF